MVDGMGPLEKLATAMSRTDRHDGERDISAAVQAALHTSPDIDAFDVNVTADAGCVRLTGKVGSYAERSEAEQIANELAGVTSVENHIQVRPYGAMWAISDSRIADSIAGALATIPSVDASAVDYDVSCHVVTLNGFVHSAAERAAVRHAVEILPGVDFVRNLIEVPHVD